MTSLNQLIDSKQKEHKVMNKVNSIFYFFNQFMVLGYQKTKQSVTKTADSHAR